ncbi:MAG TPA: phage tail protein [Acidimicrobiales bacterium]|nr:phage tail protein [Acidimicrobiales bacterium]
MAHLWKKGEPADATKGAGSRLVVAAVAVVFGALVATGVSWASIPDSGGTIHGCYKTSGTAHALKIIDNAKTAACPKGSTALNWDQSPPGIGAGTDGAAAGTSGDTCVDGRIYLYAGNTFPPDEAAANGQSLSISEHMDLFALIGTTYGGDGLTTFDLPNIESLAPDNMTYTICVFGLYP